MEPCSVARCFTSHRELSCSCTSCSGGMQRDTLLPITPPIFFPEKENGRCDRPKERHFPLRASSSKKSGACRLLLPARGKAAFTPAIRLGVLLSSAAALPISRWYSLISVYRSTHQCGERSNAAFGTQSAARLPSLAPHDSKARLQSVPNRRDSWRSHVHRTHTAQRVQLFKLQTRNVGGRGGLPSHFSWGSKGGILFGKRIPPLTAHSHANGRPPRALWARYLRRYHVPAHRQQCHAARKAHHRRL